MNTYITKKRDKTTPLVPLGGAFTGSSSVAYRRWGADPPPETRVAHQNGVIVICVASDDEVGFIIKAALALAAKSESVLAPFHREGRNFITSSIVFFVVTGGENTLCGQVPVVLGGGGSSQVHRSSHCLCVWWELSSVEYQKKHFNFLQFTYNPHRSRKK